jgi:DNA-binding PucR family transcriptional regulator
MEAERDKLVSLTHAQRLETVSLILEGAPITSQRASERLGYDLARRHLALVLWHEGGVPEQGVLERAADELARAAGAPRPFTLPQGASVLWAWCPVPAEPDAEALRAALSSFPVGVRVAVGSCDAGIAGFKRGHLDAIATQRLLSRMPPERRLAAYSEVAAVALAAREEQPAAEFLADNLGALASADPVLRQTLRTYLQEQCNASRTATRMYAHRNTILGRVQRAEELLPHSLAGHVLNVTLALEIDHWLG